MQSQPPVIKQRANTMYDNMEFPAYEFREFPMAVPVLNGVVQDSPYDARGKSHPVVIVQNEDELQALTGPQAASLLPVSEERVTRTLRVQGEVDIRKALYAQAEQAGVKIDKKWTVSRIEDTLRQAAEDDEDEDEIADDTDPIV